MWLVYAFLSALFAGLTSVLAKIGIRNVDSDFATAVRTIVVVVFAWIMVLVVGSQEQLALISGRSYLFLCLSGLATGASWMCYFRALQTGDVNKVVPIDKSSTVLTMLLAFVLLGEALTGLKVGAMAAIAVGTWMMIEKKTGAGPATDRKWLVFALLSAVFASLTAILAKVGIEGVESNLGTAIRTVVVVVMAWTVVFWRRTMPDVKTIDRRCWVFLVLSGLATGLSWLCYYRALQDGQASVVVPIDKLSIWITVAFGWIVLGERLTLRSGAGLLCITAGTLLLLV